VRGTKESGGNGVVWGNRRGVVGFRGVSSPVTKPTHGLWSGFLSTMDKLGGKTSSFPLNKTFEGCGVEMELLEMIGELEGGIEI